MCPVQTVTYVSGRSSLESGTCSHFQRRLGFDFRSIRSDNGLLEWNFETPNRLFPPILCGISCPAESCRDFFLRFSGERVLDNTVHGQILERTVARDARVYVTGLLVAQEERFAFSHNITSLTTAMRRALNGERTNVGRTAYTDRVKSMLLSSQSEEVAQVLATDFSNIERSTQHDGWFACTGSGGEDCRNHAA